MSETCMIDVLPLARFNPSQAGRHNSYVYPGELFPAPLGLLPAQCIAAAVKFDIDKTDMEKPKLVCELALRDFPFNKDRVGLPKFIKENRDNIVVMITKKGYFLMERASALEIEKTGPF